MSTPCTYVSSHTDILLPMAGRKQLTVASCTLSLATRQRAIVDAIDNVKAKIQEERVSTLYAYVSWPHTDVLLPMAGRKQLTVVSCMLSLATRQRAIVDTIDNVKAKIQEERVSTLYTYVSWPLTLTSLLTSIVHRPEAAHGRVLCAVVGKFLVN